MTPTQYEVLTRAANRERGNICPTPGLHHGPQKMVLASLERKGWIDMNGGFPIITLSGRDAREQEAHRRGNSLLVTSLILCKQ